MSESVMFYIDVFALFCGRVWLQGWVYSLQPIRALEFVLQGDGGFRFPMQSYGQIPSPDVQKHLGRADAHSVRFNETFDVDLSIGKLDVAGLEVTYLGGGREWIGHLGSPRGQRAALLGESFFQMLREQSDGTILEVGSRARSGITRRDLVPEGWRYVGMDVMTGPNVDIVGDAHELSAMIPANSVDAVMAFSVLEHLLMPWKFIVELNRVMKAGAIGIFTTHQCWPVHDHPWDFWRFSDKAWDALLNPATGFATIEAAMGEPAFVVAQRCHPITNFGTTQSGFLASSVLFRKTADTTLEWPVKLTDIINSSYPQ
jgi:hypothetical protein